MTNKLSKYLGFKHFYLMEEINIMKKISLYFYTVFLLLAVNYSLANSSLQVEQKFIDHQKNLPQGHLKKIAYVKKLLDYMYLFDQDMRNLLILNQSNDQLKLAIKNLDNFHTSKMKEILKEWGWITISKFGAPYDKKAWLLVQHADDDPFFQAGVLFVLQNLVNKKETDKQNYAYLYDRVAAKFHLIGIYQKYGTQVEINDNNVVLQQYEGSLKDIVKNRYEMGLEPLNDYLQKVKDLYKQKQE